MSYSANYVIYSSLFTTLPIRGRYCWFSSKITH